MKHIFIALFIALFGFSYLNSYAQAPEPIGDGLEQFEWEMAGRIVVQHGGRVKPLDTFAREMVKSIYAKDAFQGQHPVETYFRWMSDGSRWTNEPILYLSKGDLRSELGLDDHQDNYFTIGDLQGHPRLRDIVMEGMTADQAGEKLTFTQTQASDLMNRLGMLNALFNHNVPLLVPPPDGDPLTTWGTMPDLLFKVDRDSTLVSEEEASLALAFAGMYHSLHDGRADMFNMSASVFINTQMALLQNHPAVISSLDWEVAYNALEPFMWARILLIVSFVLFLLSLKESWIRLKPLAITGMLGGIVMYSVGMIMRWYIGGRAPWSNMYESLLAIGWSLLIVALIFELVKKDRIFGLSGSVMGAVVLGIAAYASLDRGINPLVPALQSYWLTYHVIIILASYACLALAMMVGHGVLISAVRNQGEPNETTKRWSGANLKIMQLGSVLLILGILLGAVWANVSWGRFWGWDPKETWALITWFVYIIFLHGRSAGWLMWRGLAVASVAAFPIVIMTYYGVNFYLSGLHSYGAGSTPGIPWEAYAYLGAEVLFLGWVFFAMRGTWRRRPKSGSPARVREPEVQNA
ncbi:cytochrome c biogenesis protein CcsA [bacterium]|nr:cytochrome c biogenesis protein CcsA [bacterium]